MNIEFRQLVLFAIALIVPIVLFRTRRRKLLLGWVCFTFFVQIFDTVLLTNMPAGRIVGLLYLPEAALKLRAWARYTPVKAWLINYGWLLVLGLAFGFVWPWPDTTLMRPFSLTAPGKTIIYSIRLLSDLSLAIFIAEEILKSGSLLFIGRCLMWGSTLSSLAGLFHFITRFDIYFALTGLGEQVLYLGRSRGLVGEPRALGLSCAYGVMILLIGRKRMSRLWPLLLLINLLGLLITYSASSIALFVAGIVVTWIFFTNRERLIVAGTAAVAATLIFLTSVMLPQQFATATYTLSLRFDPEYKLAGIPPGTWGQEIAYRLDVFDSCALLFLIDQPVYALTGTGPGLISLPASEYVPPGLYSLIWTPETGINSPPYHGLLLELSNGGIFGLALWFVQVLSCWIALRFLAGKSQMGDGGAIPHPDEWQFGFAMFLTGSVFYIVQVSYTPLWCVFLAIGWVAFRIRKSLEVQTGLQKRMARGFADA